MVSILLPNVLISALAKPLLHLTKKLFNDRKLNLILECNMNRKVLAILLLTCFLLILNLSQASQVQEQPSIGVKAGDWIEFNSITTGNLPAGHDVAWFKMEIINTTSTQIFVNIVAESNNGILTSLIRTIDFTIGDTEAWIIIPANLGPGDSFYDNLSNSTVTIQGEKTEVIDGVTRTVTYVHTPERNKEWDKATGVFVQTIDTYPDYKVIANAYATNMWMPQILGLETAVFYAVFSIIIILVVVAILVIIASCKKR
jgi:hypothetical protein